jgi:hypothetical protein
VLLAQSLGRAGDGFDNSRNVGTADGDFAAIARNGVDPRASASNDSRFMEIFRWRPGFPARR